MFGNGVDYIAFLAIISLVLCWGGVFCLRILAPRLGLVDVPNRRSSHEHPTPRGGGLAFVIICPTIAIMASSLTGAPYFPGGEFLLLGGTLVGAVGLADDRWGLSVRVRFCAYLMAAGLLAIGSGYLDELQWSSGFHLQLGWLGLPATLLWIVGLTNAYNFMDGIDGIAGVQGVVVAGTGVLLAIWQGHTGLAIYLAALAGGVLGFLLHNWPPARVFMGDVGSAFLGYNFAGLAVLSGESAAVPFFAWVILLAPFIFDTSFTLASRVARRERWYEAHRQHLYQRLVRRGWSHRTVTLTYLGLDLILAGIVIVGYALKVDIQYIGIAITIPLAGLVGLVKWVERRPSNVRVQGTVYK